MPEIQPLTMSPAKAAAYLGIGKTNIMELIHAGRIPVKMLDGRYRVPVAALDAFLESLPAPGR